MPQVTPVDSPRILMGDTITVQPQEWVTKGWIKDMSTDPVAKPLRVKKPFPIESKKRCKIDAIHQDSAGFGRAPFEYQPVMLQVKEISPVSELEFVTLGSPGITIIPSKKKQSQVKRVAKETNQSIDSPFLIYPNPAVANSVLKIKAQSLPTADYHVSLLDGAGAVVQQSFFVITNENAVFQFALKQLPAGAYFLQLTNNKTGKSYTETVVVR
jgi:hypothetical protein